MSIAQGDSSIAYSLKNCEFMELNVDTDTWEEVYMCGFYHIVPSELVFYQGSFYQPLVLPRIGSSNVLDLPFSVYCHVTGFSKKIYIGGPIKFKFENSILRLGCWTITLKTANDERIEFDMEMDRSIDDSEWKACITYEANQELFQDLKNGLQFDSIENAYLAIVKMIRNEFGSSFDMSPYLEEMGIHRESPSIVDVDELEREIRKMYGMN